MESLFLKKIEKLLRLYAFDSVNLPFIEEASLYFRTSGEFSDVCNKELYEVRRYKDEFQNLVLRPEGTAGLVNYVLKKNLMQTNKQLRLSYIGQMFRYNRPQRGRYRQFSQVGLEILGNANIDADFDLIFFAHKMLTDLKLNFVIEINSIGLFEDRLEYKKTLVDYFKSIGIETENKDPLKILDKMENFENVPQLQINKESKAKFENLMQLLKNFNVTFVHNPYLVRGLDYYNDTVFEFKIENMAVGAGGRYDGLAKQISSSSFPAVGMAFGIERVCLFYQEMLENQKIAVLPIDCSLEYALKVTDFLRINEHECFLHKTEADFSKNLTYLSKKVKYVAIVGKNEEENGCFVFKDFEQKQQTQIKMNENLSNLFQCFSK